MLISSTKGLRKVFIVGFSCEYHKPARSIYDFENLSSGGNSLIANQIGQSETYSNLSTVFVSQF